MSWLLLKKAVLFTYFNAFCRGSSPLWDPVFNTTANKEGLKFQPIICIHFSIQSWRLIRSAYRQQKFQPTLVCTCANNFGIQVLNLCHMITWLWNSLNTAKANCLLNIIGNPSQCFHHPHPKCGMEGNRNLEGAGCCKHSRCEVPTIGEGLSRSHFPNASVL